MPQTKFQRLMFALLSQLFFIQPLTRTIFRAIFVKKENTNDNQETVNSHL